MIPSKFDYATPATLQEAVGLLEQHGDDAKILTGGHSLIPMMRMRLAAPEVIVDLGKIAELKGISASGSAIEIGASTTHADVADSADVPVMIAETAKAVGDMQVRNVGTIGGSVVHADPAADWPAAMIAARAEMVLFGPNGERAVAAEDFFLGILESAAQPNEILTKIRIPVSDHVGAYQKVAQSASGFAIAGAAAQVTLAGGSIADAQIGVTGVADRAYRPAQVEQALAGTSTEPDAVKAACASAAAGIDALSDIHGSADYRAHLAAVVVRRAVMAAIERARS